MNISLMVELLPTFVKNIIHAKHYTKHERDAHINETQFPPTKRSNPAICVTHQLYYEVICISQSLAPPPPNYTLLKFRFQGHTQNPLDENVQCEA